MDNGIAVGDSVSWLFGAVRYWGIVETVRDNGVIEARTAGGVLWVLDLVRKSWMFSGMVC
jgi:hypothetical protein